MSKNPFKPGDRVWIVRGGNRLVGTVVKTVLARVHTQIGERVFVDDWHEVSLETIGQ